MRERVALPTAPQRERWRREEGIKAATGKALSGEMTPEQFERYAVDALEIHTWARPRLPQPHRPLQVKRFKSEFKDRHKHDPILFAEHEIFPHAPLLDHHRVQTLSDQQKQARMQRAYDLYLSDRFTLTDFAREQRFFDKYGPSQQPAKLSARIHHQLPASSPNNTAENEGVTPPNRPILQFIISHLPAPMRALR